MRNIRLGPQEGVTLPNRVKEEKNPEVPLKLGFISELPVELHPQFSALALTLES